MTTPLNVTFEPFGMDCMFEVGLIFLGTGCCPQAAGAANNSANPHTMANGRSFLILLAFIFSIRLLFFFTLGNAMDHYKKSIYVRQFRLTGGRPKIVIKTGAEINARASKSRVIFNIATIKTRAENIHPMP